MAQTDAQKHRRAHNNSTPIHAAKIVQAERRKNKISWFLFRGAAYFQSKIKGSKKHREGRKGDGSICALKEKFL